MKHLVAILFIAGIIAFFVGRWTKPDPENPMDKQRIEQLERDKAEAWALINQLMDSSKFHKARADSAFRVADSAQSTKPLNKNVYEKSVTRIDHYTAPELDSALRKEFGGLYQGGVVRLPASHP